MTFGVCTTLANAAVLADAGYDYIELGVKDALMPILPDSEVAPTLAAIRGLRLPAPVYAGFLPRALRVVGDEIQRDQLSHYVATACRRAKSCGGEIIVFGSSASRNVPRDFPRTRAMDQIAEFLDMAAGHAEARGLIVALEPLCRLEGNIICTVAEGAELVRRVNRKGVRLVADFYHMWHENEPVSDVVGAADCLAHVHVAEPHGRMAPGSSGFDFAPLFAALRAAGYDGRISCECRFRSFGREATTALQTMRSHLALSNQ